MMRKGIVIPLISLLLTIISPIFSTLFFEEVSFNYIYAKTYENFSFHKPRRFQVGERILLHGHMVSTCNNFLGWYEDETLEQPFNSILMPVHDLYLYPKFDLNMSSNGTSPECAVLMENPSFQYSSFRFLRFEPVTSKTYTFIVTRTANYWHSVVVFNSYNQRISQGIGYAGALNTSIVISPYLSSGEHYYIQVDPRSSIRYV